MDLRARALETILLSLRTFEGIDVEAFLARYPANGENIRRKIGRYVLDRLMEQDERGFARLTSRGMVIADEIMCELALEAD